MAQKVDLNKLKAEIDNRKREKGIIPSNLGEGVVGSGPRDTFLNGLLMSLKTGKSTPSTNLIKVVENTVAEKHGGGTTHIIKEAVPVRQPTNNAHTTNSPQRIDMSPERDEQMFQDLAKKNNQTLAESISNFTGTHGGTPTSPVVDYAGKQYLTSPPQDAVLPQNLNEAALVESVRGMVNTHLSENLGSIFEEAIKNTIIEMYAVERIEEVLHGNKDLIKDVVVETIKEIQARSRAKQQK